MCRVVDGNVLEEDTHALLLGDGCTQLTPCCHAFLCQRSLLPRSAAGSAGTLRLPLPHSPSLSLSLSLPLSPSLSLCFSLTLFISPSLPLASCLLRGHQLFVSDVCGWSERRVWLVCHFCLCVSVLTVGDLILTSMFSVCVCVCVCVVDAAV